MIKKQNTKKEKTVFFTGTGGTTGTTYGGVACSVPPYLKCGGTTGTKANSVVLS